MSYQVHPSLFPHHDGSELYVSSSGNLGSYALSQKRSGSFRYLAHDLSLWPLRL